MPDHNLWHNEEDFDEEVMARISRLILSNKKMGKMMAIRKTEDYLEIIKDMQEKKIAQVYELILYVLKNVSAYQYNLMKKLLFDD